MSLSISTWNYLKSLGDATDFATHLGRIRAAGFGAELWLDWTVDPALFARENRNTVRDLCSGLPALSAHSGVKKDFSLEKLLDEMDLCAYVGADPLVCHPYTLGLDVHTWDYESKTALTDEEAALVDRILTEAADRSLRLALENGPADILEAVLTAMSDHPGRDCLGICIDTGHANMHRDRSATPIVDLIDRVADDIIHLHFSDNAGERDDHAVPGEGTVDWDGVAAAVESIGYRGDIVLELNAPAPDHPDEAAVRARDFLRGRYRV